MFFMLNTTTRLSMSALLIGLLAQAVQGSGQAPASPVESAPALTDVIPLDKAVTTGTLPNGLRYYVRRNARPEKRVMLQLAVKAGWVHGTRRHVARVAA